MGWVKKYDRIIERVVRRVIEVEQGIAVGDR